MPSFKYRCDMLVDQARYIGGDPVGYACHGDAVHEDDKGRLFCQNCLDMIERGEALRITMPEGQPFGKAAQDRAAKAVLEQMAEGKK